MFRFYDLGFRVLWFQCLVFIFFMVLVFIFGVGLVFSVLG